jgi:hypothetical protein
MSESHEDDDVILTVRLTSRAWRDLGDEVREGVNGDNHADVCNRAIQLYHYLEGLRRDGNQIFLSGYPRNGPPGTMYTEQLDY